MVVTSKRVPAILYISYDGMLEPLGQSQVLGYLRGLAQGREIHLISFEKTADWKKAGRREALAADIAGAGIHWHPMRYHKRPSAVATAYDIAAGTAAAIRLARRHGVSIVHARSYVPAVMALAVKRATGAKFLFDIRGFWSDERVDAGLWSNDSMGFRLAKRLERRFFRGADHVVALTEASAEVIRQFDYLQGKPPPITVIPTCADLSRFSLQPRDPAEPFTLGFVGAAGTWSLFGKAVECFRLLLDIEPEARFLVVNRNEHGFIEEQIAAVGVPRDRVEVVAAEHRDVPALIGKMTVGAAIRMQTYSQLACAPTKLAEYLGCGVPVLVNTGIGDAASIVAQHRVGVVVQGFSDAELRDGVQELVTLAKQPEIASQCRQVAEEMFSLERGATAYEAIYSGLVESDYYRGR